MNFIRQKLEEEKDEYKNKVDPKWLEEVLNEESKFKNFDEWCDIYEPKPKIKPSKPNKHLQQIEIYTIKKILSPIGKVFHKGAMAMMLEAISTGITITENFLREHDEPNLANILNSINGIILSFRFQKHFKLVENQKDVSVLSKQFKKNSKKMRYFRRVSIENLCKYLDIEKQKAQEKVIEQLVRLGEITQQVHQKLVLVELSKEEIFKVTKAVQKEIETRFRDKIINTLKEKRSYITKKIEQSEFFFIKGLIAQQIGLDQQQEQLVQNFLSSGMDQVLELIFHLVNSQLDAIFVQIEAAFNKIFQFLNLLDLIGTAIQQVEQQVQDSINSVDFRIENIQKEIEKNYAYLRAKINQFVKSIITMIEQMAANIIHEEPQQ